MLAYGVYAVTHPLVVTMSNTTLLASKDWPDGSEVQSSTISYIISIHVEA